jgi:sec-independent protein translocase protein TatA
MLVSDLTGLSTPAFTMPGTWEWVIIALVVLLLFGGRKLPELARGLAKGLRGFKEEMRGIEAEADDVKKAITDEPAPKDDEAASASTDTSETKVSDENNG